MSDDYEEADLAAERERYAALCIGDPASGDAFVPPAPAAVTLRLRDDLAAERERVERLRDEVLRLRAPEGLGGYLSRLHPGDLDEVDRG